MNIMEELCELKEVIYVLSNGEKDELPIPDAGEACLIGCPNLGILVIYLKDDGSFEYGFAPKDMIPLAKEDLMQSPFIPMLRKVTPEEWFSRVDFARFEDYAKFYDPELVASVIGMFLESVEEVTGAETPAKQ